MKRLGNVKDLALATKIPRSGVYRLWAEGRIPGYRFGRILRFDVAEVLEAVRVGTILKGKSND